MPTLNSKTKKYLSKRLCIVGAGLAGTFLVLLLLISWGQERAGAIIQERLMQIAQELNIGLGIGNVSVKLLRLKPSVAFSGLSLGSPDQDLVLSSTDLLVSLTWVNLFRGNAQISDVLIKKASLELVVDDSGNSNWDELVALVISLPSSDAEVRPFDELRINNMALKYRNQRLDHEGAFSAEGKLDLKNTQRVSTVEVTGDLNSYVLQSTLKLGGEDVLSSDVGPDDVKAFDRMSQRLPTGIPISAEAVFAELELVVNARLESAVIPVDGMGTLNFSGRNAAALLGDLKLLSTHVSTLSGGFDFVVDGGEYLVENATLVLGASEFEGYLQLNTVEQPSIVSGHFISSKLALNELLGTGAKPLVTQAPQQSTQALNGERLFSSRPFEPSAWFSNLQGSVSGTFNTITRGAVQIDDLSVNSLFENDTVSFELDSEQFAGGSLSLKADLAASDEGNIGTRSTKVSFKMQKVQLLDVLSLSGLSTSGGRGRLSGEGTFWLEGFSPSSVAASIDGGLFTIIEDGELDSLLIEMAGVDLMESISLLIKRDLQQTAIRCGFFDVQASAGVIEIKDFIIDTEDSFFLAKGRVNLKEESVSFKFEPHPRDASFFAAPTALIVSGSLLSPSMRPGKSIYSRIAIAGALAALASPAAIVLPFIEIGRGGAPTSCDNLFSQ